MNVRAPRHVWLRRVLVVLALAVPAGAYAASHLSTASRAGSSACPHPGCPFCHHH